MDETRRPESPRPIWPLLSLLGVIFVLTILLTQVDLSKLISPLLAGRSSGRPEFSAVMGVMLVVLIGLPVLALGLLVRSLKRHARSSQVREEAKTAP